MKRHIPIFAALAVTLFALLPAAMADTPAGRVTGKGTVIVDREPDRVRMEVDLVSEGKDIHDVLTQLKTKQDALGKQLTDAGAIADTIHFGSPELSLPGDKASRLQQIMAMQMGGRPQTATPPAPYKVTVHLTAEWPLKGATAEERIVNAMETRKRISTIEFGPPKTPMTPAAAEDAEERAGLPENALANKPGDPTYLYVKTLAPEERTKILADAFAKAKENAAESAQAAGRQLGDLVQIGGTTEAHEETPDSDNPYAAYYEAQLQQFSGPKHTDVLNEATGSQPGQVQLQVDVVATFAIK